MRALPVLMAALVGAAAALAGQQAVAEIGSHAVSPTIRADLGAKRLVVKRGTEMTRLDTPNSWSVVTSQQISIPAGQKGIVVARFSAKTLCTGQSNWTCYLRITIDGVEMYPRNRPGDYFVFASVGEPWGPASAERTFGGLGPGTHQVRVEGMPSVNSDGFWFDHCSLSLEYWRQS